LRENFETIENINKRLVPVTKYYPIKSYINISKINCAIYYVTHSLIIIAK